MAAVTAVNSVGESIVALLRARRDLLNADGLLAPLPATMEIAHLSLSRLATGAAPASGLTLTCLRIMPSDHPRPRTRPGDTSLAVELQYLLAAWSTAPVDEQSMLAWAMLELSAYPVLDRSVLVGADIWERDETVQIVPEAQTDDGMYRLWGALQMKLRLASTFRARVIRIERRAAPDWPPVVATRFGFGTAAAEAG